MTIPPHPLQPLTHVDTPGRLAAAAAVTAGLVASSVVSLVLVTGGSGTAGAARAGAATRSDGGLGIAGTAAHRSPAVPSRSPAITEAPARPTASFSSSPVAVRTPLDPAPVVYTVRPGDNLTVIARWFKVHGYEQLYLRNRAAIGADPNLIRPGQVVTITPRGVSATMSVGPSAVTP